MKGLALDSSHKSLSLAVTEDGQLLAERFLQHGYTHSETLMPEMLSLFESLGLDFSDFDFFAVTNGPGSYTGLRIGLSTMKSLAWYEKKPLFTFSTLEVMKRTYDDSPLFLIPSLDARSERIFSALYKGKKRILPEGNRLAPDFLDEVQNVFYSGQHLPVDCYLTGDGCAALLKAYAERPDLAAHFSLHLLEGGLADLRAYRLALLAEEAYLQGGRPSWDEAQANYCSPTQAERVRQDNLRNMFIRPAVITDLDAIHFIEHSCFPTPWSKKSLSAQLDEQNKHAHLYIIFKDDSQDFVLGYAGFYMHVDEAEILNIAVLPEGRRSGVGRKLLTHIMVEAKKKGAERITLEVRESNAPARSLYASMDFKPCGVRHNYYDKPREDALILEWCAEA